MTIRVVVTGAVGFIGGHACQQLLDEGFEVVGLDNFDQFYDRRIKEETLASLTPHPRFTFVEGDIRDKQRVIQALENADAVIHLAAKAGVLPSLQDPVEYTAINVAGTVELLEGCRSVGVRRLVFASSSSVYGNSTTPPFAEDAPALDPLSPYAATKRAGELLCKVYAELHGLRVAALRFFTVYGPRQRPDLAIHRFTRMISHGETIKQYGDGSSLRDYTHIRDTLSGLLAALRWTEQEGAAFEVFNLGESRTIRLDRLIQLIGENLGVVPRVEIVSEQPGEARGTHADISKAKRILGYDPNTDFEDGLREFVAWYKSTHAI